MSQELARAETVSLLQELGLKEYEARCFLALSQLSTATAKEISEISEVPRTRVYDAIRVLEAQGLVEVQHSSPQRFRSVGVTEAAKTLRQKYDDRITTLETQLDDIDLDAVTEEVDRMQEEVWSLTGHQAIASRTLELLGDADSEIVLVVVEEAVLTETLFERLRDAAARDVTIVVGSISDAVIDRVESELPDARVFESGLDWVVGPEPDAEVAISRLLLVDRTTLLVSSYYPNDRADGMDERAVFATGLGNGIVVLIRRLLSTGLLKDEDPAT